MAKVCGAFFIVSSIYLFSVPRGYVASVMLAPETSNTSGISGSLSSLASIAGVKIDGEAGCPDRVPAAVRGAGRAAIRKHAAGQ